VSGADACRTRRWGCFSEGGRRRPHRSGPVAASKQGPCACAEPGNHRRSTLAPWRRATHGRGWLTEN